jgi:hypothetical protein
MAGGLQLTSIEVLEDGAVRTHVVTGARGPDAAAGVADAAADRAAGRRACAADAGGPARGRRHGRVDARRRARWLAWSAGPETCSCSLPTRRAGLGHVRRHRAHWATTAHHRPRRRQLLHRDAGCRPDRGHGAAVELGRRRARRPDPEGELRLGPARAAAAAPRAAAVGGHHAPADAHATGRRRALRAHRRSPRRRDLRAGPRRDGNFLYQIRANGDARIIASRIGDEPAYGAAMLPDGAIAVARWNGDIARVTRRRRGARVDERRHEHLPDRHRRARHAVRRHVQWRRAAHRAGRHAPRHRDGLRPGRLVAVATTPGGGVVAAERGGQGACPARAPDGLREVVYHRPGALFYGLAVDDGFLYALDLSQRHLLRIPLPAVAGRGRGAREPRRPDQTRRACVSADVEEEQRGHRPAVVREDVEVLAPQQCNEQADGEDAAEPRRRCRRR